MATVYFPKVCDTKTQPDYNLPDVNLTISGYSTSSTAASITINTTTGGTFNITATKNHYNDYSKTGCTIVKEYECDVCGGPVTGATCPTCGEPLDASGKQFKYQVTIEGNTDKMGGKIVMTRADNVCMTEKDFTDAVISGIGSTTELIYNDQYIANQLLVNKTYINDPFSYVKSNNVKDKIDSGVTRGSKQAFVFKNNFIPKEIAPAEIKYIRIVSGKTVNITDTSLMEYEISGIIITNVDSQLAGTTSGEMFIEGVSFDYYDPQPDGTKMAIFHTKINVSAAPRVGTITFTGTGAKPQTATVTQGAATETFNMDAPTGVTSTATGITVTASATPSGTIWLISGGTHVITSWSFTGEGQTHTFSIAANTGYTDITYILSGVTNFGTTGTTRYVTQEAKAQSVSLSNTSAQINATATTIPYTVTFASPQVTVQLKIGSTVKETHTITTSPKTSGFTVPQNEELTAVTYTIVATTQNGAATDTAQTIQKAAAEDLTINAPTGVTAAATTIPFTATTNTSSVTLGLFKNGSTSALSTKTINKGETTDNFTIEANINTSSVLYVISGRTSGGKIASKQVTQAAADAQTVSINVPTGITAEAVSLPFTADTSPCAMVYLLSGSPIGVAASMGVSGTSQQRSFGIVKNTTYSTRQYTVSAVTQNGETGGYSGVTQAASAMSVMVTAASQVESSTTVLNYSITANPSADVYLFSGTSSNPIGTVQTKIGTTTGSFTIAKNTNTGAGITYVISATTSDGHFSTASTVQNPAHYYIDILSGETQVFLDDYNGNINEIIVSTNVPTLNVVSASSHSGKDYIFASGLTFEIDRNGYYHYSTAINMWGDVNAPRYGYIYFSGAGIQKTAEIAQSAATPYIALINVPVLDFAATGGNANFTVASNIPWTASTPDASIISFTGGTTGDTGQTTLPFTVAPNTNPTARTAQVKVKNTAHNIESGFTINQTGATPYIVIKQASTSFTATGGTGTYTVSANTPWTASTTANTMIALTGGTTGSTGQTQNSFSVANYTGTTQRSGNITITGNGVSTAFTVTQEAAADQNVFTWYGGSTAKTQSNIDGTGTTITITGITSTHNGQPSSFSVSEQNFNGAEVSITAGTGTIEVEVPENGRNDMKEGDITFMNNEGLTIVLTLRQKTLPGIQPISDDFTVHLDAIDANHNYMICSYINEDTTDVYHSEEISNGDGDANILIPDIQGACFEIIPSNGASTNATIDYAGSTDWQFNERIPYQSGYLYVNVHR